MKILIGDEIKKILNLINYSKYKKNCNKENRDEIEETL
jgi:hypothetical protein